jgi:hypothetical protein
MQGRLASPRGEWRALVPTLLLLAVASVQLVLVHAANLTPWKGGGFGMFAAVDGSAARSVRIVVDGPERSEVIEVPPSLVLDADRAAAFPAARLLRQLAEGVAARERRRGRPVDRVTVEAWTASLSDDGSQANLRRLAVHVLEVGADQRP